MRSTLKTKLTCHDRSNHVWSVTKTKQDNDVIDCIGLVYAKIETELSGPFGLGAICDEN